MWMRARSAGCTTTAIVRSRWLPSSDPFCPPHQRESRRKVATGHVYRVAVVVAALLTEGGGRGELAEDRSKVIVQTDNARAEDCSDTHTSQKAANRQRGATARATTEQDEEKGRERRPRAKFTVYCYSSGSVRLFHWPIVVTPC